MAIRILRAAAAVALALALGACGSTSKLQREQASDAIDFSKYQTIVVSDFGNKPARAPDEARRAAYDASVSAASQRFAALLVAELRAYGARGEIVRGEARPGALVIDGDITRYKDGNVALRLLIGFGAGSSYFDADVRFIDGDTGQVLGRIEVDKNSWPLGGALAALQDADAHMAGAAARIAEEVAVNQGVVKRRGEPAVTRRRTQTGCGRGGPGCDDG